VDVAENRIDFDYARHPSDGALFVRAAHVANLLREIDAVIGRGKRFNFLALANDIDQKRWDETHAVYGDGELESVRLASPTEKEQQ
jgi:hypothetical protein